MTYIADLHIHSPYSRATSKNSNLAGLYAWAKVKGIHLVGTGDFTHPGWLKQLKDNLEPAEPGLFRLKDEKVAPAFDGAAPEDIAVRFVLSAEISSIYKRNERVRKVHNLLVMPDFSAAEKIAATLARIGNIESDGRPILGLDSRDLLEIVLENGPEGFLVPAHIWTPWFSLFGSKSGFDLIEDCFDDLTKYIFALETGLSSDPAMNRMVSALDRFTLISNSDCHSPAKLGREANVFNTELNFFAMRDALKNPEHGGFRGTIEFFPEEGKYHFDGHRKCQVCLDPVQTRELNSICPVCNRPVTVGVTHRVMELADREAPLYPPYSSQFQSFIPLQEVLGEILGLGPATKGVLKQYGRIINRFGSEFNIYMNTPVEELNQVSSVLGEAISRMRQNKVYCQPGYDGEFGVITVFEKGELDKIIGQASLFEGGVKRKKKQNRARRPLVQFKKVDKEIGEQTNDPIGPNSEQLAAISSQSKHILVSAGPGTGKTYTLVARIVRTITEKQARPEQTFAITFTNKAAEEMKKRLDNELDAKDVPFVGTFHRFCLNWLRQEQPELAVVGNEDRELILKRLFPEMKKKERAELIALISDYFEKLASEEEQQPSGPIAEYQQALERITSIDIDGVIPYFVCLLRGKGRVLSVFREQVRYLFIDEFQDINFSQYQLVEIMAQQAAVFAIGDPNQAIYGFRGSDLNFFFNFAKGDESVGAVETISLNRNYRSASLIIDAAQALIAHNSVRNNTVLMPLYQKKGIVELYKAATPEEEGKFIIRKIEELVGGTSHLSVASSDSGKAIKGFADISILYRLNSQKDKIIEALTRQGIPFQQVGATPFYMGKGLCPLYYFMRCASGDATFGEHVSLLKGVMNIGPTVIDGFAAMDADVIQNDFFANSAALDFSTTNLKKLNVLAKRIIQFRKRATEQGISSAIEPFIADLKVKDEGQGLSRFVELATVFGCDLKAFSQYLKDNSTGSGYDKRAESVALMTLHGAKGLEFPVVFIAGLEDGVLPHISGSRKCDLEEERRLFYVGVTRAKERLILSWSATRMLFGRQLIQRPSSFLGEIPFKFIKELMRKRTGQRKINAKQLKLF